LGNSLLISFCITLTFIFIDAFQEWKEPQWYLQVAMTPSVDADAQIYFDVGNGLNEKNSAKYRVKKGWVFQVLEFPLPRKPIQYIRFDPLDTSGKIELKEIKLVDEFGELIQSIGLRAIEPFHQINSIRIDNDVLVASTDANANDPMFFLNLQYPIQHSYNLKDCIMQNVADIPKKAIIVFLLSWTVMLFLYFEED
jgi:hypothetical protein